MMHKTAGGAALRCLPFLPFNTFRNSQSFAQKSAANNP
jgi:hypothetical protein